MKRMHVHVAVENLPRSIDFYTTLFGTEPAVVKPDYAKWMLNDPRVNFAISDRTRTTGVDHLGIQVDSGEELAELAGRLKAAGEVTRDQAAATCCYAKSDKAWVDDPSGLRWETFHTRGEAVVYGEDEPGARERIGITPRASDATAEPTTACC